MIFSSHSPFLVQRVTNINFLPTLVNTLSIKKVMRNSQMINWGKLLWSCIEFSQLILHANVRNSVWRICIWILGLNGQLAARFLTNQPIRNKTKPTWLDLSWVFMYSKDFVSQWKRYVRYVCIGSWRYFQPCWLTIINTEIACNLTKGVFHTSALRSRIKNRIYFVWQITYLRLNNHWE